MSKITFVFGASGAGKTTSIIPKIMAEMDDPKVIEIDDIKRELSSELPDAQKNKLRNAQFNVAIKTAISENKNIIISFPFLMLNPKRVIDIYKAAKLKEYDTEAVFVPVSFKRSEQGVDYRYVQTLLGEPTGEVPRRLKPWRNKILHLAVPVTLKILKESKQVNRIRLFNRDGTELLDNKIKTFFAEQNRKLSKEEQEDYSEKFKKIQNFLNDPENRKIFNQKLYQ
ncbi:MAG: zeta toxin family protein [Proteobacteria bacterium]|nr:zeta toxin family protein [Pseudomonadota bacterium]